MPDLSEETASNAVEDDEFLLRWIPESQLVPGEFRVQSEMFRKPSFSVDREAMKALVDFMREHTGRHVARFQAQSCRALGYQVRPDPLPGNAAHALVQSGASQGELRRMARTMRDQFVELIRNDPDSTSRL